MDEDPTYEPGERHSASDREGASFGCLGALIFALPTAAMTLLGVVMGDCMIDHPCHRNDDKILLAGLAIIIVLAALFGLSIRVLVRWARLRGTGAAPGGWSLAWAIPVAIMLGLTAIFFSLNFISLM